MAKSGPVLIVEDDPDDQEMLQDIFRELGFNHKLIFFSNGPDAYRHLKSTNEQPFLILSDINMPRQNGIELKRHIDEDADLRSRSIPFVFFTTTVEKPAVDEAYKKMTVQGFFQKSSNYEHQKMLLKTIMDYWTYCNHPNS